MYSWYHILTKNRWHTHVSIGKKSHRPRCRQYRYHLYRWHTHVSIGQKSHRPKCRQYRYHLYWRHVVGTSSIGDDFRKKIKFYQLPVATTCGHYRWYLYRQHVIAKGFFGGQSNCYSEDLSSWQLCFSCLSNSYSNDMSSG